MSKITFRADDDLVNRLEGFEASKSEVMREALRAYLDGHSETAPGGPVRTDPALKQLVDERVEVALADKLLDAVQTEPQDVNVAITLEEHSETASTEADVSQEPAVATRTEEQPGSDEQSCPQCGESVAADHVYCPNCGERASRHVYCECGEKLRSEWAFCPGCGRPTPAADLLNR